MHEALFAAGLVPPYVLVGLSLGGPFVRVFTVRYPSEVRALVLVDPAHERFFERVQRDPPELGRLWTDVNRAWAAQMPTARHIVVPGSGHKIQVDQPAFVAKIIRNVVERAQTGDSRPPRP